MKTLLLIRHAKSGWDDLGARDFDRQLSTRGEDDAPRMGKRLAAALAGRNQQLDRLLASSAARAARTAQLLAAEIGYDPEEIEYRESLYLASPDTLLQAIHSLDDRIACAAVVAHNPGIAELAGQLIGRRVDHLPTCSIVTLAADLTHWRDLQQAELLDFDYPKRAV